MKKNMFCLGVLVVAAVFCLTGLNVPVFAADDGNSVAYYGDAIPSADDTYPVIVYSTYNNKTVKETITAVEDGEEYKCKLNAPNGFVLPSSVLVKVNGVVCRWMKIPPTVMTVKPVKLFL